MLLELSELGSFLGGIGVIFSVIYLGHQIRLNTISNRGTSYQAAVSSASNWMLEVGKDPIATKIILTGARAPDALTPAEMDQFHLLLIGLVRNFENIHYQFYTGAISEETWEGWSKRIQTFLSQPGTSRWWQSNSDGYTVKFQAFVNATSEPGGEPSDA